MYALSVKWLTTVYISILKEVNKMKSLQFLNAICDYFAIRAFATNVAHLCS